MVCVLVKTPTMLREESAKNQRPCITVQHRHCVQARKDQLSSGCSHLTSPEKLLITHICFRLWHHLTWSIVGHSQSTSYAWRTTAHSLKYGTNIYFVGLIRLGCFSDPQLVELVWASDSAWANENLIVRDLESKTLEESGKKPRTRQAEGCRAQSTLLCRWTMVLWFLI